MSIILDLTKPASPWSHVKLIEEDPRLAQLTSIDFSSVTFGHALRDGEEQISFGETRQRLLSSNPSQVMLGATFAEEIVEHGEDILEGMFQRKLILQAFTLLGSIYHGDEGKTYLLSVYRHPIGGWHHFPFAHDLDQKVDRRWVFPLLKQPS